MPDGGEVSDSPTTAKSATVTGLTAGVTYSITVSAPALSLKDSASFMLQEESSDTPGGGSGGKTPSGRTSGRAATGGTGSTTVTPGRPLTSGHESGDKDMTLYASLKVTVSGKAMKSLTVGDTDLKVTLDNGSSSFKAKLNKTGTKITLTPSGEGSSWQIPGQALKKLNASGVATLAVTLNGESLTMSTAVPLSGTIYTALRCEGYPEATWLWIIDSEGLHCQVNGRQYLYLSESGTLTEEV